MIEKPTNLGIDLAKLSGGVQGLGRAERSKLTIYSITDITATTTARTLDATYVAYELKCKIAHGFPYDSSGIPVGNPTVIVNRLTNSNTVINSYGGGGTYYDDGTNKFIYKEKFYMDKDYIYIYYLVRRIAGSLALSATTFNFRAFLLSPELSGSGGSKGGGITPDVYVYYDTFTYNVGGSQTASDSGNYGILNATYYALGR